MKNKVSIIIATFNGGKYIRTQLDSLFSQTHLPNEIIVVDDNSTDDTQTILKEYSKRGVLNYVINENHIGVNGNFEKALRMATGDYIMFCDQDDYWFPDKVQRMLDKMIEIEDPLKPCVVSSRNIYVNELLEIDSKLEPKYTTIRIPHDCSDFRATIIHHLSQGCAMILNRKCLDYILPFPNDSICYDHWVGYIVAMVGIKYDMKEPLMYYRVHNDNVTARINKKESLPIKRFRGVGVVPSHYIETYKYANTFLSHHVDKNKIDYVNKIIELSDINISLIRRLYLLITTPKIPFKRRYRSLKCHFLNHIFNN